MTLSLLIGLIVASGAAGTLIEVPYTHTEQITKTKQKPVQEQVTRTVNLDYESDCPVDVSTNPDYLDFSHVFKAEVTNTDRKPGTFVVDFNIEAGGASSYDLQDRVYVEPGETQVASVETDTLLEQVSVGCSVDPGTKDVTETVTDYETVEYTETVQQTEQVPLYKAAQRGITGALTAE